MRRALVSTAARMLGYGAMEVWQRNRNGGDGDRWSQLEAVALFAFAIRGPLASVCTSICATGKCLRLLVVGFFCHGFLFCCGCCQLPC